MAKYLMINSAASTIRLAPGVDTGDLVNMLARAAEDGRVVDVVAVLADQMPGEYTAYINARAAVWWAVVDLPDPDER